MVTHGVTHKYEGKRKINLSKILTVIGIIVIAWRPVMKAENETIGRNASKNHHYGKGHLE